MQKFGEKGVKTYALIDGSKTAERIMNEAGVDEDFLLNFLEYLEKCGWIKLERTGQKENSEDSDSNFSVTALKIACEGGVAEACNFLGLKYHNGSDVAQNSVKETELFSLACERGLDVACFNLGMNYYNGRGVARDYKKAEELFITACDGYVKNACFYLANIYVSKGKSKSEKDIYELFKKGCSYDKVNEKSCEEARKILLNACEKKDYALCVHISADKETLSFLDQLCEEGWWQACEEIGLAYKNGREGIPENKETSKKYLNKACSLVPDDVTYFKKECEKNNNFK